MRANSEYAMIATQDDKRKMLQKIIKTVGGRWLEPG
jgi:hypothetical protein